MYEKLIYESGQADNTTIAMAEKRLGCKFDDSFIEFYKKYDGVKFKNAKILASDALEYDIRQFIEINALGINNVELWDNNLLAFAEDLGGNFFVFKKTDMNSIYFWDHETEDLLVINTNFGKFLDFIEGYKLSEVEVPDDAITWIDPNFLQELKYKGEL